MAVLANRRRGWRNIFLIALLSTFICVATHRLMLKPRKSADIEPTVRYSTYLPAPLDQHLDNHLANGCFVFITCTSSMTKVRRTMFDVQRRFNDRFNYPYVFLSDEPFSEGFMQGVRYMAGPNNSVEFGLIDSGEWVYPEWINPHRAEKVADDWANSNKMYADRVEWRHMVRYWSGPFADHSLLQKYQYMWRLEPGSHYTCDFEYDPFVHIQRNHLSYGFAISLEEMPDAVPSLLTAARAFVLENPVLVSARENSLGWLFGPEFNRCQFLTNFEIVDLNFVRSAEYRALFAFLDQRGGIYYERWTDATVRSLAAAMFLRPDQVHWFEDVGYVHDLLNNCPQSSTRQMRCYCDPSESSHTLPMSCSSRWNSTSASLDPNSI